MTVVALLMLVFFNALCILVLCRRVELLEDDKRQRESQP